MRKLLGGVIVVSLLLVSGLAFAQPAEQGKGFPKEKKAQIMETLQIWKLVDCLNLSEEQLVKFLPKWKEEKEIRKQHHAERREKLKELEGLTRSDDPEIEGKLADELDEMEKWESDFQEKMKAVREEMKSILTTKQRALLLVSQERFGREVRELLERVRETRSPGMKRREHPERSLDERESMEGEEGRGWLRRRER